MPGGARHGLALAAGALRRHLSPPSPLHRPLFLPSAALARRLQHSPYYSTTARALRAVRTTNTIVGDMIEHAERTENGSHDVVAEPKPDSSPRPPPQLKPGDSFGSDFYGELNGFSLDSPTQSQEKDPDSAENARDEEDVDMEDLDTEAEEETEPPVVLSFKRKPLPPLVAPTEIPKAIPPSHWSHKLYCGPHGEEVIVDYCYTFEQSEKVAQKFLNEPVLGFDMEWYPYPSKDIKLSASVLQFACQDRIAIFHLARHEGTTAAQIVPPSVKRIIESADILKCGVHITTADAPKLRGPLQLNPKGLFEVSHLYNLLGNRRNASGYVLKTTKSMAAQVEQKLGLPLLKDSVRISNWHKPLNQSQIDYAAADAYAGFMLFHVMNEERKCLKPTPPRPGFAELRQNIVGISEDNDAEDEEISDESNTSNEAKVRKAKPKNPKEGLQGETLILYDALTVKRSDIANEKRMKPFYIATNQVLRQVALSRPQTIEELKRIKGLGEQGIRNFGQTMLDTIKALHADEFPDEEQDIPDDVIIDDPIINDTAPKKQRRKKGAVLDDATKRLYDALCDKRRDIAAEKKIPAWELYRIANNGVLSDIAKQRPSSLEELQKMRGVGDYSAKCYGPSWLSVISDFENGGNVGPTVSSEEDSGQRTPEEDTSEEEALYISANTLPPGAEEYLSGERIVFTGILDVLGRTGAEEVAKKCGAEVMKKADNETNLVITGRNVSESKIEAIQEHNLPTMTEEEFLTLINRKAKETRSAAQRKSPLANLSTLVGNNSNQTATQAIAELPDCDRPFFNALKAFRLQLSRLSNMPPETICSDADLFAIALAKPQRRSDLLRIPCARNLDATARQHKKSVDEFLLKHQRRNKSAPAGASNASRKLSGGSSSESSEKENAFERMDRTVPPSKWSHGGFVAPPPDASASRKRKF